MKLSNLTCDTPKTSQNTMVPENCSKMRLNYVAKFVVKLRVSSQNISAEKFEDDKTTSEFV